MALSIEEVQILIQKVLSTLQSDDSNASGLNYLVPAGYRPEVVLKEGGRKKRRNASFDHWSPENGEISISFTREKVQNPVLAAVPTSTYAGTARSNVLQPTTQPVAQPEQQLCDALDDVERQGRAFIALKWFRDDVLPSKGFTWAVRPDERQAVLARAIDNGLVVTSKVANPRSPSYPTTAVRLNRNRAGTQEAHRRYAPMRIRGEGLSETILRDRGSR